MTAPAFVRDSDTPTHELRSTARVMPACCARRGGSIPDRGAMERVRQLPYFFACIAAKPAPSL